MPFRPRQLLAALALALAARGGGPTIASATPTAGTQFNRPDGTAAEQYAIANDLIDSINSAPAGAVIRMAFYSITIQSFADALVAAHQRGVQVRILMDDHAVYAPWTTLVDELGGDTSSTSFAALCHRSCFTDYEPSYLHAKFYMFSTAGTAKRVVTVSSANPTNGQAITGWNDAYTMIDPTMYDSYKQYFEDLTAGSNADTQGTSAVNYYRTTTSGNLKTYFFPRSGSGATADTVYSILGNVSCSGAAAGYGSSGHTVIKVAMFQWTKYRVRLAKRLWSLDDAGCQVEVIYTGSETDPEVLSALKQSGGRNGGITLHDASKDTDGDGVVDYYVHDKYFTIDGNYAGDTSTKAVFTGSANFANNALHYNNEIMLKIVDNTAYADYLAQFGRLRAFADSGTTVQTMRAQAAGGDERLAAAGE